MQCRYCKTTQCRASRLLLRTPRQRFIGKYFVNMPTQQNHLVVVLMPGSSSSRCQVRGAMGNCICLLQPCPSFTKIVPHCFVCSAMSQREEKFRRICARLEKIRNKQNWRRNPRAA